MTCMSAEAIVLIMTMQARWICLTWGYVFLSGSDSLLAGLAACESWEVSLHDSPVFASCFGGQRLRAEVTDGSYFVWLYVKFVFKFVWPDKHQCHWGSGWSWKMRRCRAKDVYAHVKPFVAFFLFELCSLSGLKGIVTWYVSLFQVGPGWLWPVEDVSQSWYSLQVAGDYRF